MNNRGFSLVELIAVIVILGLLAIITTPAYDTVSKNIKTRNYESKKSVISKEVIEFVEDYLKDEVYGGEENSNTICFSPNFLIVNGIVTSDDEEKEYIENDVTGKKYKGTDEFVSITYNVENKKLKTTFIDENELNCTKKYK